MIVPAPLRPGSTIAVIAPASPFPRTELFAGLAWLGSRYRLSMRSRALSRAGFLAGSDEQRAAELWWALRSPRIEAIVCARGGYGVMRVLERMASETPLESLESSLRGSPKWVLGFSDVTALHVALCRAGVASIHGPNVTGLARATSREKSLLLDALEGRAHRHAWSGLHVHVPGGARGPVFGGNLALLESMAAAGQLTVPSGAIVLLEDVTERPYRVDRMLTALRMGGHLERAAAIVVGEFDKCEPGPDGVTIREVLEDRLGGLGIPVVFGAPFGHGDRNEPFVIGATATLSSEGSLIFE